MARGDVTLFEEFVDQLGSENHNLENGGDVIKVGLINNDAPPAASDATPTWSDYSANEVDSVAGGYPADGLTLANQSYAEVAGIATFDADNIAIVKDVAGFTDAYWGIIYNSSNGSGMAIGFVELDGPLAEASADVNINWHADGIFTVTIT